jgi:hypothetical protein
MKTWAKLDENNIVVDVVKIADDMENAGDWLASNFGDHWQQSYAIEDVLEGTDEPRFGEPAGIGFYFDPDEELFIPPAPQSE